MDLLSKETSLRTGASESAAGDVQEPAEERWNSRPILAALVRLVVHAVPLGASIAAAIGISGRFGSQAGWAELLRWAVTLGGSTIVLVVVARLTRRLVPLAMLLRMSLVFPDKAPARFSAALRAGAVRKVNCAVTDAAEASAGDTTTTDVLTRVVVLLGAHAAHDPRTRGHCERVRALNDLVAEELKLPRADRDRLRWAALLHDIGKLHVHAKILNKPAAPTPEEWKVLKAHPGLGAQIVEPLREWLGAWVDAVGHHHERFDGAGYPNGLAGRDISLAGRIVAVVDAFEVMTARRPYQRPVSAQAAREELVRCAGTHFDPHIVRAFVNVSIGKLRSIIGPLSWLAQLPFIGGIPQLEGVAAAATRQVVASTGTATAAGVIAVGGAVAGIHGVTPPPRMTHTTVTSNVSSVAAQDQGSGSATTSQSEGTLSGNSAGSPSQSSPTSPNVMNAASKSPGAVDSGGSRGGSVGNGAASHPSGSSPAQTESPADQSTNSGDASSGSKPANSGSAPANSGTAPGHSGSAPANSGTAPGNSGTAPGNSGTAPGNSGTASGNPGNLSPSNPGNSSPSSPGSVPGNPGNAPGHSK